MILLGIETSCDETAAAVASSGPRLLSNVVASQTDLHEPFGGVVPEIAARRHVELITLVVERALQEAGVTAAELDAVAVTNRPGLIGSLLIGVTAAQMLGLVLDVPVLGIHHIEGHLFSAPLAAGRFPSSSVALVASGGHTDLYRVERPHRYRVLGRRRDDAAGEAFDKGARLLGLGAGGGAALERLAQGGAPDAVRFPRARTDPPLDFSFSGLKTALRLYLRDHPEADRADLAASFQQAIVDVLVDHTLRAAEQEGVGTILLGGGVAANSRLRARLEESASGRGLEILAPPRELCTDNAAMIAAAGLSRLEQGETGDTEIEAAARSPLPGLI